MRLRRSELSTPGSSDRMIKKAAASDADLVFLDLEDSVAPSEKVPSRARVIDALTTLDWGRKIKAVRINDLESPYAYRDIIDVVEGAGAALDVLIVPKVKQARDVWWVDRLLTQLEVDLGLRRRIGLEVLIEEVDALINVDAIAHASPRLEALILGTGDLSASQGVSEWAVHGTGDYPGDVWHYARNRVVVAARSAGIDAIDGPFVDFADSAGYRTECRMAQGLGFVGKWAIHPSQIADANDVYAPTEEEVRRARRLTEAYAAAQEQGLGSVAIDGRMVDAASVRILEPTLARAELLGL